MINFSHALPESEEKKYRIISVPFQVPLEIASSKNPNDLRDWVVELVLKTIESVPGLLGAVQTGKVTLYFPGLSHATYIAAGVLHGLAGHFLPFKWQVRGEGGFEPIDSECDVQAVREQARAGRNFGRAVESARSFGK